jgi:hypothetical protein
MAHIMDFLRVHEPHVHYAQIRPMRTAHLSERMLYLELEHGGSITMDCSEACSLIPRLAGLHTPWVVNGQGNTETILRTLPHYHDPARALVGALVVFEPSRALSQQHVAMVRHPDKHDPVLWSHGQERGPLEVRLSAEAAYHGGSYTFCSIAKL